MKKFFLFFIIFFITMSQLNAETCNHIFPSIVATVNNGQISLNNNTPVLTNIPNNILFTHNLVNNNTQACDGGQCSKNDTDAYNEGLPFNDGSAGVLNIGAGNNVQLTSGDYYYQGINLNSGGQITVNGSGTVRIHIQNSFNPNGDINFGGDPENVILFVGGDVSVSAGADINAIIYSAGIFNLNGGLIEGVVTAENININSGSIRYNAASIQQADFNSFCTTLSVNPIADYHLDECLFSDGDILTDATGNSSGIVNGSIFSAKATDESGVNCRVAGFNGDSGEKIITDYTANGSDVTMMYWIKPEQARRMFFGSHDGNNHRLYIGHNANRTVQAGFGNEFYVFTGNRVNFNSWNHLAITASGGVYKAYLNGAYIGQEAFSFNGSSSTPVWIGAVSGSGWSEGIPPLGGATDEFKVFNNVLSDTEIQTIYNNELAGNNYDGSARECVSCSACDNRQDSLILKKYNYTVAGYIDSFAEFESAFASVTKADMFSFEIVDNIDGTSSRDTFLSEFSGYIYVPQSGVYNFAVDGDDAVELMIDGNVVASWYGGHGRCNCTTHNASITLSEGYHSIKFRHHEYTGEAYWHLYWQKPGDFGYSIVPKSSFSYCSPNLPIHEWRLDECKLTGSNNEIVDSIGGIDGTPMNGLKTDTGKVCKAGKFDGVDDYVELPSFPNITQDFSITAWFKTDDRAEIGQRIFADDESNSSGYAISVGDGGAGRVRFYHRGQSGNGIIDSAAVIGNNIWYFMVAVTDVTNGLRHLYIYDENGIELDHQSMAITGVLGIDTGIASIGGETDNGETANRFIGLIDEVNIYDNVLNSDMIDLIFSVANTGLSLDGVPRSCGICCENFAQRLNHSTYNVSNYNGAYIYSASSFQQVIKNYATDTYLFGSGFIDNINTQGSGNNPFGDASYYLTVMDGFIKIDTAGDYTFAVNGDDAVEVLIDGQVVSHWYGIHPRSSIPTTDSQITRKTITLASGYHKLDFHHHENTGNDNYELHWRQGSGSWNIVPSAVLFHCVAVVAEWRMDECSFDNGIVRDSSDNNFDGVIVNSVLPSSGMLCNGGYFPGVESYVTINDEDKFDDTEKLTISMWFNAEEINQTNGTNARGLISKRQSASNNESFGIFFWNGHGDQVWVDIDGTNDRFKSTTIFQEDNWYYLTVVFDGELPQGERVKLYVNGALDSTHDETSTHIPGYNSNVYIGNLYYGTNSLKVFKGKMDEVRIINEALDVTEINAWMNETRNCPSCCQIDRFEIQNDGNALACEAELVTIKAVDSSGIVQSCYTGSVTISANNGGLWYKNIVVNDNPDLPTGVIAGLNSSTVSYTFQPEDNGEIKLWLRNSIVTGDSESVEVFVTDGVNSGSSTIDYYKTGFKFAWELAERTQLACKKSNEGWNSQLLDIVAIQIDPETEQCISNLAGNRLIHFTLDYILPNSGTRNIFVNDHEVTSFGSDLTINFTAGKSSLVLKYNDAGKISLTAEYDSTDPNTNTVINMEGETEFVVRPLGLYISTSDANPQAVNATDGVFKRAGEDFNLKAKAVCWTAITDENNNGVLGNGTDASVNNITPNYLSTNVSIDHSLIEPLGGDNGSISITSGNFISGLFGTNVQSFSEVGIIKFTFNDINYVGSGFDLSSTSVEFGRFTPDHFNVTVADNGTFANACNNFTYSGEPFGYSTQPVLSIEAENADNITTKNYQGQFVKLGNDDVMIDSPLTDSSNYGDDGITLLDLGANILTGSMTSQNNGFVTYVFNTSDSYKYTRNINAIVNRVISDVSVGISSVIDLDGIANNNNLPSIVPTGTQIRYGQMHIMNNFGPETENLQLNIFAQEWNGNMWVINVDDNCTTIDDTHFTLNPHLNGGTTQIDFFNGIMDEKGSITLGAPGAEGTVDVQLNSTPDYFDWLGGGEDGTATFGIYRGRDRIISWEEIPAR